MELERQYSATNYGPLPAVLSRGEGVWVWDVEGNKYLDMLAGYSALSFGHGHPKMMEAMFEQAKKLCVVSRAFYSDQLAPFAKELSEFCGMEMMLPMNTGAEAVESAIKTARKWAYTRKNVPHDKAEIIVCEGNFHGRTTTIVGFSSVAQYRDLFGPATPGFVTIPFGDPDALEKAITPNTAAFLFEPIQGEGGINIPEDGFLKRVREICTKNNVLMIADEVQTGMGRTGTVFACDHENVKPDMYIMGKTLGGGVYPVSAIVSSRDILSVFQPGDHGSTFGGNPLAAAVGRAAMKLLIDEDLCAKSVEMGEYFRDRIRGLNSPKIKGVRGRGMLTGIEVHKEAGTGHEFVEALLAEGILCKETVEQVVRVTPPLVITKEELDWAIERFAKVFA
ncbi:MAG: ornithine--oxo-acid transaminase [Planctomycetes bacterium]|nr:ornithine--oxo-acid transaminase [Planctomycetota bacterium]NOG54861.1 ornithine--oxo-acid transaminase [Planctomycetota bacterium]